MRLNAWLARAGVASRRKADELIKDGRVTVNGEVGQLNTFVATTDEVRLDGRPLAKQRLAYVLLYKPAGAVTTASDPQGRRTVVDLVQHPSRVVPVGRLDADTTGALLLTNDGELAHRLAHPKYEVDKVYEVETWTQPSDADLERLREGVELDDGPTSPAEVRRLPGARIELTIHEGRNRQVKRMFEAVGHRVRSLHRSRYGPLTLEGLESGRWRELEPFEVEQLRSATKRDSRPRARGLVEQALSLADPVPRLILVDFPLLDAASFSACRIWPASTFRLNSGSRSTPHRVVLQARSSSSAAVDATSVSLRTARTAR